LEQGWDKTAGLKKLFYAGPMFRAERPQAGRYREFWQIGAEYFGNPSPQADADMLLLIRDVLGAYGLKEPKFFLNSIGCAACRPAYRKILVDFLAQEAEGLCEDCRRRMDRNPLRALDCKVDGPRLSGAPKMADHLCEDCRAHERELDELLSSAKFVFEKSPRLVRGLDYYTRTVFEVTAPGLGAQDALAAGGRYDLLVKMLGGPDVPAIGFALGMDRVARARYGEALAGDAVDGSPRVFVALAGGGTGKAGFQVLQDLREAGFAAEIGAPDRSLKAQMRWADSWKALWVVIIGETELARGGAVLRNLKDSTQEEVPLSGLLAKLHSIKDNIS
ncbi:MAG: histidine--tRNA ligase, partial [Elusimicrobia bacterium]|nr:histidine--tRNA ligase [Elusimicrobiota bacterium]